MDLKTFKGPWAGLPVAWTDEDVFDGKTFRGDIERCCEAGIPGVYSGGSTGEFFAMELDEFKLVSNAMVEECHACGKPAMVGCSSTYSKGACVRAAWAAKIGADAIQVALPFWTSIDDNQIVPFLRSVSEAAGHLPLSIYDTARAKKVLTVLQHHEIRAALPNYVMVKSTPSSVGATAAGCRALSEDLNVFVAEHLWSELGPLGAVGACSALVYWNPGLVLGLWEDLKAGRWDSLQRLAPKLTALNTFLATRFGPRGFTDTAYDRMGGRASGFLKTSLRNREPYQSATQEDVEILQDWYRRHFPEMLEV